MYLEISARQSGKTTRMVESICQRALNGQRCIVFGFSKRWSRQLHDLVYDKLTCSFPDTDFTFCTPMYFNTKKQYIDYINHNEDKQLENHYFYYDEFDFYTDDVIISDNGYYATTAKYTRTLKDHMFHLGGMKFDTMIELMNSNNNKVVSYTMSLRQFDDFNRVIGLNKLYSDKQFNCDIANHWSDLKAT